jgi:hypothetical protein
MSYASIAQLCLYSLRENRSSFKGRDSSTNRSTASNARLSARTAKGVESKRMSSAQSAELTQLSHSSQRKADLYCAEHVSEKLDQELPLLWLRSEKLTHHSILEGEAMPCSERLKFAHQFFPDGSIDSICARCSVTVASVANEADLVLKEGQHVCDPFLLAHYEFFKKMPRSETVPEHVSRDQKLRL